MENLVGRPFPNEKIDELKVLLTDIAYESGKQRSLEMLKRGYETTTMTRRQYNEVFRLINSLDAPEDDEEEYH